MVEECGSLGRGLRVTPCRGRGRRRTHSRVVCSHQRGELVGLLLVEEPEQNAR